MRLWLKMVYPKRMMVCHHMSHLKLLFYYWLYHATFDNFRPASYFVTVHMYFIYLIIYIYVKLYIYIWLDINNILNILIPSYSITPYYTTMISLFNWVQFPWPKGSKAPPASRPRCWLLWALLHDSAPSPAFPRNSLPQRNGSLMKAGESRCNCTILIHVAPLPGILRYV
jgi:hypothetical protein